MEGEEVCRAFRNTGRCRFGDTCKFVHSEGEPIEPPPRGPCFEFQESGSCKYGDSCRFAHGDDDERPRNAPRTRNRTNGGNGGEGGGGRSRSSRGPRNDVCYLFRDTGECPHGENCRFRHGEDDTRDFSAPRDTASEICRNYLKGRCRFGDACPRRHEGEVVPEPLEKIDEVCKNFLEGRCRFGDACRRQHPSQLASLGGEPM